MIHSINKAGYYDTAWEWRSREIYERSQASKNTIFIGGLSAYSGNPDRRRASGASSAGMKKFELPVVPALRLDATKAFVLTRNNPRLICRTFVAVGDKGLLVLDRVDMPGRNPVEVRTHTEKQAEFEVDSVLLAGRHETARMTFASDRPSVLRRATALLTDASAEPPVMMRWQTLGSESRVTMASLLTRGSDKVDLKVHSDDQYITVVASGNGWKETIRLTLQLEPEQTGK